MEPTDRELMARWRDGDDGAGELLFERYYATIGRFFANKAPPHAVADLVQDTFLRCVKRRDNLRDSDSYRPYLLATARFVLLDWLRLEYRGAVDPEQSSIEDLAPGPLMLLEARGEQRLLLRALRRLCLEDQILMELRYWEQVPTREIAEIVGRPHATVRTRITRARATLREWLEQLAESQQELDSTITNFEDWMARCREALPQRSPG